MNARLSAAYARELPALQLAGILERKCFSSVLFKPAAGGPVGEGVPHIQKNNRVLRYLMHFLSQT